MSVGLDHESTPAADALIVRRLLGSGPWAWTAVAPLAFFANNLLLTPWGVGEWKVDMRAPSKRISANFVGQKHSVTFNDCWAFTSVRMSDGNKASGSARIEPLAQECRELTN